MPERKRFFPVDPFPNRVTTVKKVTVECRGEKVRVEMKTNASFFLKKES